MRLYTGFLGAQRINGLQPTPMFVPVVRPDPTVAIGILRSVCRIHVLKTTPSLYAATLLFVRASDLAIMGGGAVDTGLLFTTLAEALVDRDTRWNPDEHFRLEPGDGLFAVFQTYTVPVNPEPRTDEFVAEIDILFAYTRIDVDRKPTVDFMSPGSIARGVTTPGFIIGDAFVPGAAVEFFAAADGAAVNGVTATSVSVISPNRINATFVVTAAATKGPRDLLITNPGGLTGGLQNALQVL